MLRIRASQRVALRDAARACFVERAGAVVLWRVSVHRRPPARDEAEHAVLHALDRGRAYGRMQEMDVILLAEVMLLTGGDIERDRGLGWAHRWLVDNTLGDLPTRLLRLRGEALRRHPGGVLG